MSSTRILARLHKKGADQAPRLAAFTECVVEYFGGDNGVAKVYTWLESNSLIISDSQTPQSKQLYIKHPSFCPIRQLSRETVELPEATLSQGINTGVAIILESSDGKVLLTKRAAHLDAFPNVWVPPGGHVELNETLTEAGLRELHEETGLCITEEECQGRELTPLVLWESVYPPRLSLGIPKKHHIVLYLHAKLTENHTSDKLFDQLKFDPAEVAACVWVDHSIIKSIVQQCEERTVGDVERNPKLSQTIRALTLDEQQKQVVRDISIDPLLQRSSLEQDCERFATVYKARDTKTDTIVAVKKIKVGTRTEAADGINRTALREIKYLQELSHPNIIGLMDVFGQKSNVSLVFDFMETDLEIVIKDTTIILTAPHIKAYMLQTLLGLEYLHAHWILHRDLKPNNLLINNKGVLKIGDFGLARVFGSPSRPYSNQVVTRWYRCPELLYGAKSYGTGVDMWAVGCILAELLIRLPFLPGETDLDQLQRIFQVLGTPSKHEWPDLVELPDYVQFREQPKHPMKEIFTAAGDDLLAMLERMLALNPLKRCTATQALTMPYFSNKPYPAAGHQLPMPGSNKIVSKEAEARRAGLKRKQNSDSDRGLAKRLVF